MIKHVVRRVQEFDLGLRVVVATDDARVGEAVRGLDVESVLTSPELASGTERVAAVLELPEYRSYRVVLNVQGDEPLIERDAVAGALERVMRRGDEVGTAGAPLDLGALGDPNRVKVMVDGRGRALAFFRTPRAAVSGRHQAVFQHVGVYAYRAAALWRWVGLPPTPEEESERLEQIRPLAHGFAVGVALQSAPAAPAVDTESDIPEIERRLLVTSWGGTG